MTTETTNAPSLRSLLAGLCTLLLVTSMGAEAGTVILVRHAEKVAGGSKNPNLTAKGRERAAQLADSLQRAGVAAIYSTDLCRTAQTAAPVAQAFELPLHVQRVSGSEGDALAECEPTLEVEREVLPPDVANPAQLAEHIKTAHTTETVLIVGHSNTVPAIIRALLGTGFAVTIDDDAYGDLFIAEVPTLFGEPSLIRARFGR